MRASITLLIAALFQTSVLSAQTSAVEVRVLDKSDKVGLIGAGVELIERGIGKSVLAENGICYFDSVMPGFDSLRIASIGYYRMTRYIELKVDTVTKVEASLILDILKYSDGGECGTPTNGDPPPRNYARKNMKISYTPIIKPK